MKVRFMMLAAALSATMMSPRVHADDPPTMDQQLHKTISNTCMLSLVDQK